MASRALLQRFSSVLLHPRQFTNVRSTNLAPIRTWTRRAALPNSTSPVAKVSTMVESADNSGVTESKTDDAQDIESLTFLGEDFSSSDSSVQLATDWSRSYHGLSTQAFSKDVADILLAPIDPLDIEVKPGTYV